MPANHRKNKPLTPVVPLVTHLQVVAPPAQVLAQSRPSRQAPLSPVLMDL